jgi:transcriptional antiterminator
MMSEKRLFEIIAYLLNQSDYLSMKEIAQHFRVSAKTIYNDIHSIEFERIIGGACLDRKPKRGIKLIANKIQKNRIDKFLDQFNFHSFKGDTLFNLDTNILLLLFTTSSPVTLDFIAKQLYTSKTSILNHLPTVEKWLKAYHLSLIKKKNLGLSLDGTEMMIRKACKEICFNSEGLHAMESESDTESIADLSKSRIPVKLKHKFDKIFSPFIVDGIIDIVNSSEVNLNEAYTDFDYINMVAKLCIMVLRNKLGKLISSTHHFPNNIREKLVAQLINIKIENLFHLSLSEDELNETTYAILTTRKQYNCQNMLYDINTPKIINQFTNLLSSSLNIDLVHDKELENNLLNHLKPAIRRIRYGIRIENPLLSQIKYEYTNIYIAVMTAIEEIEKNEGIIFDSSELGYICLHIVAAINRSAHKRYISCELITEGGVTISTFLKSEIEKQFAEISINKTIPLNKYKDASLADFDLILNATKLSLPKNHKSIAISPLFNSRDQSAVRTWLLNYEYNKIINKDAQIRNNILFFKDRLKEKNSLLKKYCELLMINNDVLPGFFESVQEREKRAPTSLGRGIAVPHGSSSLVKHSIILTISLESPILWDKQLVDLIFLIAINFSETKIYRNFFEKLFYIISDEHLLAGVKRASNAEEIKQIIFDSSNYKQTLKKQLNNGSKCT